MSSFLFLSTPCVRRFARTRLWQRMLLGVAFAASPFLARAVDGPLSLEEAVRLAEATAPVVAAQQAAVDAAQAAIEPAGALPDPQLIAGIENLPVNTGDAFSVTRDFMTMRKVGVMQDVPRHAKRAARSERAEAQAARERAMLNTTQLTLRESVARAWIARATAEQRLDLLRSLQPRAEAQVAAATAQLTAGHGTAAEAIAAKAEQAMLADRLDQTAREVEEARAELVRWLPESADRALGAAPDWSDLGGDPDSMLTRVAHHRELLSYDAAEHIAAADIALAQADKRPDWSVELAYAQRGPAYSNMVSLQFRVGLPLFAAHRQDPLIASKQAVLAQIEAERDDAVRMHTAALRKTLAAWRDARDRVQRYERELLPLANDRAEAALAAYRGGRGDLQATLAAFDAAVEQRVVYTELVNTLGQAWAGLRYAFAEDR